MELPNKLKIQQLREESELKCFYQENMTSCNPLQKACLFNITADPCEFYNLIDEVYYIIIYYLFSYKL